MRSYRRCAADRSGPAFRLRGRGEAETAAGGGAEETGPALGAGTERVCGACVCCGLGGSEGEEDDRAFRLGDCPREADEVRESIVEPVSRRRGSRISRCGVEVYGAGFGDAPDDVGGTTEPGVREAEGFLVHAGRGGNTGASAAVGGGAEVCFEAGLEPPGLAPGRAVGLGGSAGLSGTAGRGGLRVSAAPLVDGVAASRPLSGALELSEAGGASGRGPRSGSSGVVEAMEASVRDGSAGPPGPPPSSFAALALIYALGLSFVRALQAGLGGFGGGPAAFGGSGLEVVIGPGSAYALGASSASCRGSSALLTVSRAVCGLAGLELAVKLGGDVGRRTLRAVGSTAWATRGDDERFVSAASAAAVCCSS